jgi:asparagine synthase (glutamine-hydrolysing)
MCGIAGMVHNGHGGQPTHEVSRMLNAIRHRGPDQFGIYHDDHAALGSARLSIIDLTSGQQPICNETQRYWIVFNGEVFNYRELRAELIAKGHVFTTNTDTEVVLHLYEDHGPGCLTMLNGQFAIAIWDVFEERLFLARDRLGVRPLFYTEQQGKLRFASEIKSLLVNGEITGTIDPVALAEVFRYWSPIAPRTIFRGVHELPAGHYAIFRKGALHLTRYWQLRFHPAPEGNGWVPTASQRQGTIEEFRDLLQDAVRLRLRADVPVGGYLSGGLDSSTITALIRQVSSADLRTFSIAFGDPEFDESEWQQQMALHLGTRHEVVHASHEDIGKAFPAVVWHAEVPILRTAPVPMFLLSALVRDNGIKVVLTGEGADEFLGGYDIFKETVIRQFWARHPESSWRPGLFSRLYPEIARLGATSGSYLAAFFRDQLDPTDPYFSHRIRWRNGNRLMRFLSDDIAEQAGREGQFALPVPDLPHEFVHWGALERAQYLEATVFLSEYLLSSQGDRMSMGHSVEGRYPFLDHRVVEFACKLPAYWKLHGLTEKYLLREMAKPLLPKTIGERRKRPYRAPIHRCFFPNSKPLPFVEEMLSPETVEAAGLFQSGIVTRLVRKATAQGLFTETEDMALAGILSAQLIQNRFVRDARAIGPLSLHDDVKYCQGMAHYVSSQAGV